MAFLGGRILGYKCLEVLGGYQDIRVEFVIAHKKDGEAGSDWNPPILTLAKKLGYPTLTPPSLKDPQIINLFQEAKPDLILNPFCNRIIPKEILDIPKLGTINFHYGKLPEYKGRFIVSHIILNDEKETAVTAHFMEEEVDSGDIIFEEPVKVFPNDTAKTLYLRCTKKGVLVFKKVLDTLLKNGDLPRKKQNSGGNYYPFEEPNGCQVDLSWTRDKIERFIRAVTFEPISKPWIKVGNLRFDILQQDQ